MDLIQIEKCDTENIVSALRASLAHNKFDIDNVVGMGNNNASAMAGINKVKKSYSFINPDEMCSSPCHWPCLMPLQNAYQGLFLLQKVTTGFQIIASEKKILQLV